MIERTSKSQMPAGVQRYGASPGQQALTPTYIQNDGIQKAPPSGVKFQGDGRCVFRGEDKRQCRAYRAHGTDYCQGHLKSLGIPYEPKEKETKVTEHCSFIRDDGSQCKGYLAKNSVYCAGHKQVLTQKQAEEPVEEEAQDGIENDD